ncbi:MAG TPA: hypothetical protein DDY25_07320, partial [Peptococcaceae bacterium]|nr:hypothetical protein [Peptococcaceae bacterium]
MSLSQNFADLRSAAIEKLEAIKEKPLILVGTATCGRAAGALEVLNVFREEVSKHQLDVQVEEV